MIRLGNNLMINFIKCIECGNNHASLQCEKYVGKNVYGEQYEIDEQFYLCTECGCEFVTEELHDSNLAAQKANILTNELKLIGSCEKLTTKYYHVLEQEHYFNMDDFRFKKLDEVCYQSILLDSDDRVLTHNYWNVIPHTKNSVEMQKNSHRSAFSISVIDERQSINNKLFIGHLNHVSMNNKGYINETVH